MISSSQKEIIKLAIPITLGNVSQMMLHIIDNAMVGQISYKHLAAASLVNSILGIPYVFFVGATSVISSLVAERKGANQTANCGSILSNAFYLFTGICIAIVALLHASSGVIHFMGQEEEVTKLARPFLIWMLWSIVPMIVYFSIKQFCDGLGHTRVPMILSLLSIPLNTFLNYLFIYGNFGFPRMELEGSGLATFITRMMLAIAIGMYVLLHSKYKKYSLQSKKVNTNLLKKISSLALPSGWQYASEVAAFAILAIVTGWYGATQQAAHQISISVAALTFMVSMGISSAASIKIGEQFGKRNFHQIEIFGSSAIRLSIGYAIVCAILFILFNQFLSRIFTADLEVIHIASYLFYFAAAFQIVDSVQCVGIGMLRGIQDTKLPSIYVTFSYWFIGIPLGIFLAEIMQWQVYGVWTSFVVCLSMMAGLLLYRFYNIVKTHLNNENKIKH